MASVATVATGTRQRRGPERERKIGLVRRRFWFKVVLSLIFLWHGFALIAWNGPASFADGKLRYFVQSYMIYTGCSQGWAMFAPDPYDLDVYIEAQITYADGKVVSWEFPRMEKMGYFERYQRERWRKYIEVAQKNDYSSVLWPSMVRYAAQVNDIYPGNPPTRVHLYRHFHVVTAPMTNPGGWGTEDMTVLSVDPSDLK